MKRFEISHIWNAWNTKEQTYLYCIDYTHTYDAIEEVDSYFESIGAVPCLIKLDNRCLEPCRYYKRITKDNSEYWYVLDNNKYARKPYLGEQEAINKLKK